MPRRSRVFLVAVVAMGRLLWAVAGRRGFFGQFAWFDMGVVVWGCQRACAGRRRLVTGAVGATGSMTAGQIAVIWAMGLMAVLSAVACWYFSTHFRRRTPGVVALMLLTGFMFLVNVLWGSVYYVSCQARRLLTFESVVEGLTWPVLGVSILGLLATGLVFVLIVRREVSGAS